MKLISMQIALFTQNLIARPDLVLNEIDQKLGNVFDAMPTILNLPVDVPAEIPLVQAKSKNNIFALNISRSRIDFLIHPNYKEEKTPFEVFKQYKSMIDKYYKTVLKSVSIKRIGVICTLFEPSDTNVQMIYDKYLKEKYRPDGTEVTIRTNNQTLNQNIVYNNIRNIQNASIHVGNEDIQGVLIQFDTNNVPSDNVELSADIIANIISHASSKIKANSVKELI